MTKKRINNILVTIYFCFFLIVTRLFYWQIIKGPELRHLSLSSHYTINKNFPKLGHILSSDNFPLSLDRQYYLLSIYKPNLTENVTDIISQIDKYKPNFSSESARQIEFFQNDFIKWVTFQNPFNQQEISNLTSINGLSFEKNLSRYYPENLLAKNLLLNLENYYRRSLSGKTGFSFSSIDGTGQSLLTNKNWQIEAVDGQNLKTSLNRQIQLILEKSLLDSLSRFQAESASGIITNPKTGEIIAMFSTKNQATTSSTLLPSISDTFEPGSIFKPLVVAMALNDHKIKPDYICPDCDRQRQIGQYTINNWDNKFHPNSDLLQIITNSDNIGMSAIIKTLGLDSFKKYYSQLKLDQKTGVDLIGESISKPKNYWSEIDLATAAFGQGFAINELQMLTAFNSLANNGTLISPHLNQDYKTKTNIIFDPETVNQVIGILKYATENGVASIYKPDNLEACAKSGTAQISISGQYTDTDTIGSYIGFSPCTDPKFSMIITINKAKSSTYGSSTAAPLWYEIAKKIAPLL